MTHDEMIEVIAAHRDGRIIQSAGTGKSTGKWFDYFSPHPPVFDGEAVWRIKPEPHWTEIENIAEFVECFWNRFAKGTTLTKPLVKIVFTAQSRGYTETIWLDPSRMRDARLAFDYLDGELRKFKERVKNSEVKPDANNKRG